MARKTAKPAKRAARKAARSKAKKAQPNRRTKAASRPAGGARTAARPAKKSAKRSAKKAPPRPAKAAKKAAATKPAGRKGVVKAAPARKPAPKPAPARAAAVRPAAGAKNSPVRRPPTLDRERRTIANRDIAGLPSSLDMDRSPSAARSGRKEMRQRLTEHTSTGPAMTGGDVDADWASAEAVGDEAPGGDNPTPDQDVVDEIGRALGVEYDDDEELQGGDEIRDRDKHRWELDPASREDLDEE